MNKVLRQADETTPAKISVQFYVTSNFKSGTADVAGYIAGMVAEANLGFSNSDIPITLSERSLLPAVIDSCTIVNKSTPRPWRV